MIRQHHRIKTAVALSAITAAVLIAGCGGSSSSGPGAKTVRAAYVSSSVPGYQIAMKVTGNAGGHTINLTGTGAFEPAAHASQLTLNLSLPTLGGGNVQVTAVTLGTDVYVKLPA